MYKISGGLPVTSLSGRQYFSIIPLMAHSNHFTRSCFYQTLLHKQHKIRSTMRMYHSSQISMVRVSLQSTNTVHF